MDKKKVLYCGVTQEDIDAWKAKYGEVFLIGATVKGKEVNGIFRKPGIEDFSKALKYLSPDPNEPMPKKQLDEDGKDITPARMPRDMMRAGLIYFLSCKLAIDPELEEDQEAKAGVCIALVTKFKATETILKNL